MSEPVQVGGEWWSQAEDGSWLKWNERAYRWDPQATAPPAASVESPSATGRPAPPAVQTSATAAARDFEPVGGKARVLTGLTIAAMAIAVVRIPLILARASDVTLLLKTNRFLLGLSQLGSLVIIGTMISFLFWFKAAYDNLEPLGASNLRYTPGWAIGAWFIPIGNLFMPKQLANDMWRASDPNLPVDAGDRWKFERVPGLLTFWWLTWILRNVLTGASGATESVAVRNADIGGVKTALRIAAGAELVLVIAGIAMILVVRSITTRQNERARMIAASSPEMARALGLVDPP